MILNHNKSSAELLIKDLKTYWHDLSPNFFNPIDYSTVAIPTRKSKKHSRKM